MRTDRTGFFADRKGGVAIYFALSLIPLATAVGAAVDYSRASTIHSGLQSSTDAAALSACKSNATTTAALRSQAQAVLDNANAGYTVVIDSFTSTNNPRTVNLVAHVTYNTKFMQIANITQMNIASASACGAGEQTFEIAMVLDTTGSMSNSAGSSSKIEAMKSAATSFVSTMFSSFDTAHLKMALVPFAASVKLDPLTYAPLGTPLASATWMDQTGLSPVHWQNVANPNASGFTSRFDIFRKLAAASPSWAWGGCFEALPYPYNVQDTVPSTAQPGTLHVPLFAPDEEGTEMYLWNIFDLGYQDISYPSSENSYMDDGVSSSSSSCNSFGANDDRMSRACKYVTPKNIHVSTNGYGPNWGCTSQALQRLTTSQTTLTLQIATLQAGGNTNIAEGMHWGWQTVSPNGAFRDGQAYTTANLTKVVVLMTDGVNTWNANSSQLVTNSQYSAYGYFRNATGSTTTARLPTGYANLSSSTDARNAMDQVTGETCTNMKAAGVVIYSVAFSTPGDAIDASGQSLIRSCASGSDKFFLASDSASLNAAFTAIAQGIGALRITR